jgi:hypothetical protein
MVKVIGVPIVPVWVATGSSSKSFAVMATMSGDARVVISRKGYGKLADSRACDNSAIIGCGRRTRTAVAKSGGRNYGTGSRIGSGEVNSACIRAGNVKSVATTHRIADRNFGSTTYTHSVCQSMNSNGFYANIACNGDSFDARCSRG